MTPNEMAVSVDRHLLIRDATLPFMPGLHLPLLDEANAAGIPLELGKPLPWLTGRGHLCEYVQDGSAVDEIAALGLIHESLGGDTNALASKRPGNPPTPDLIHRDLGCIIEVDEVQHFTSARLRTFEGGLNGCAQRLVG